MAERRARRLTLGLAASVLALVAAGAAGGLWVQRQGAARTAEALRQREAVETALDKAHTLGQQARWAEARAVLEQTRDRLAEGGAADLRQRVEQATADLALVDRLETIRLKRSTLVTGKFDNRGTERDYAAAFRDAGLGADGEDAETVAARIRGSAVGEQLVAALDDWAAVTNQPQHRAWLLEVARRADPDPWRDRFRDPEVWNNRVALEALAKELLGDEKQLAKQKPPLLVSLGRALRSTQADAVPLLAAAQARHPDDFWLNFDLGYALFDAKKWDEAVGFYRGAIAVRPVAGAAHHNLGIVLGDKKDLEGAIREFRAAIDLDGKYALPPIGLGTALRDKMDLDGAIREYRIAIDLNPKVVQSHNNLGTALYDKKDLDGAIREFRAAIDLDPKEALPHHNLGIVLRGKKDLDGAIREFRAAIDLDPKNAVSHYNLANILRDKKDLDGAIKEYRTAIDLRADYAEAHCNLGQALRQQGQFADAAAALRKGHELGSRQPGWPYPSAQWVKEAEHLNELDRKLPAVLEGKEKPADDAERLALARFCQEPFKKLYAASSRFYAEAFAHDAKLADDMRTQDRYNAACVAALAGCGQGNDADKLDDQARGRLRQQTVEWLRADLAHWTKQAASDKPGDRELAQKTLQHWQEDTDLAGVRDKDAVAKLPADEREACQTLWADVEALLQKALEKTKE